MARYSRIPARQAASLAVAKTWGQLLVFLYLLSALGALKRTPKYSTDTSA